MGVSLDRTPKCHPEMAGEGIEYVWALAKLRYRRSPIIKKRSKEKFRQLVTECTNHSLNLNVERVRSCSKKARSYMKLYKAVQSVSFGEDITLNKHTILESTLKVYRKLKKKSKSHRNVLDQNLSDIFPGNDYNRVIEHVVSKTDIKIEGQNELIGALLRKMSCN